MHPRNNGKLFDRFAGASCSPDPQPERSGDQFRRARAEEGRQDRQYLNSPESEIYHKSKSLYGIYFAKKAIVQLDNCYLVEGYTDVISLHQAASRTWWPAAAPPSPASRSG